MVAGAQAEGPTSLEQTLYRLVAVEGWSLPQALEAFELPPQRIAEIRTYIDAWTTRAAPQCQLSLAEQRLAAQRLAVERLEYLYSELTCTWRAARPEEGSEQPTGGKCGRPSLLVAAARIAVLIGKFQLSCVTDAEKAAGKAETPESNPPDRACSDFEGVRAVESNGASTENVVNDSANSGSTSSASGRPDAGRSSADASRPAQPEYAGGARGVSPGQPQIGSFDGKSPPKLPR